MKWKKDHKIPNSKAKLNEQGKSKSKNGYEDDEDEDEENSNNSYNDDDEEEYDEEDDDVAAGYKPTKNLGIFNSVVNDTPQQNTSNNGMANSNRQSFNQINMNISSNKPLMI
jgi:hypothetical protein